MNPSKKKVSRRAPRPASHKNRKPKPPVKTLFAQPGYGFYTLPALEVRGRTVLADQCRAVLLLSTTKICLDMGRLLVSFYGEDLQIESLSGKRVLLKGRVETIQFAERPGEPDGEAFHVGK